MRERRQDPEEKSSCRACWYETCKRRHKNIVNVAVNVLQEETVVNHCNTYTLRGGQAMILEPRA